VAASSDHSARARIWVAFLLLFVFVAVVSVGAYYLGKLQETIAVLDGRIALDAVSNAEEIDAALARHPSNRVLKLIATATKAGIETSAATEKLSQEMEPPALSKEINLAAASRNDLEALRGDLKTAEANATSFLPRYLALVKAEHDRLEAYARSLNLEKNVFGRFMDRIDARQADIAAVTSNLLSARAEYYRAYEKCAAALVSDFGIYKVTNGQFVFPLQYMANRYNAAAGAKAAAAKRVAELEEKQRTLMQPSPKAWARFVSGE
jgi:hypothetical protein